MPRLLTNEEVVKDIDEYFALRDQTGGVNTTLSAAAARLATTITLTAATGAVAGDRIRIGSGNRMEEAIIESLATNVATLRSPLFYAHPLGDQVVERDRIVLGEVTTEGVKFATAANTNKLKTSTTKGTYVTLLVDVEHSISAATVNHSLENLALMAGMPDTAVTGAGTVASPHRLVMGSDNLLTLQNLTLGFVGNLQDGRTIEKQAWNCDMTPSGDMTYTTGQGVPVPIAADCRAVATLIYP